jgi:hypothetical protein
MFDLRAAASLARQQPRCPERRPGRGELVPLAEAIVALDRRQRLLATLLSADDYGYASGDEWVVVVMQEVTCHLCAGMSG